MDVQTDNVQVAAIFIAWEMTKQTITHADMKSMDGGEAIRVEFEKNCVAILKAAQVEPKTARVTSSRQG